MPHEERTKESRGAKPLLGAEGGTAGDTRRDEVSDISDPQSRGVFILFFFLSLGHKNCLNSSLFEF